jgi:UDP-hydrolysing UDP-N-acetyl-D-glucosamine 2-epimerase
MPIPRRIAVVTGTRAEAGLLRPVMHAIADHPDLQLQLVVAGMHLVHYTHRDLPFTPAADVPMQHPGHTGRLADARALGRGIAGFADAFDTLDPDAVLVLGDRIEAFAAASAASIAGHLLVHMHGGDRAQGVADEAMRHAITKLAHLHLPATAQSRRRILRMGEPADRVHRVGSPAVDGLGEVRPADDAPACIVMQHPVGDPPDLERQRMHAILKATDRFTHTASASAAGGGGGVWGGGRLVMAPNADPGREGITQAITDHGITPVNHLPRDRWLATLRAARVLVGNSSAGLIEAAVLKTATVNIGRRQAGRETPANVINLASTATHDITAALDHALTLNLTRLRHPYGRGDTGPQTAHLLATLNLQSLPRTKQNSY